MEANSWKKLGERIHDFLFKISRGFQGIRFMGNLSTVGKKICDLVIVERRNRWDHMFGFLRFKGVENALKLERQLEQIVIRNVKMHVNLQEYKRRKYDDLGFYMKGKQYGGAYEGPQQRSDEQGEQKEVGD